LTGGIRRGAWANRRSSIFAAVLARYWVPAPAYKKFRLDDVYLEQFQRDDNAQAFAAAYTGFFKAAYEPCLFVNLSDKHTPENRQHVIDLFSQKLESALAQDPKKYSCRWVLHLMLISKKQK